jgi:hypothetical protein
MLPPQGIKGGQGGLIKHFNAVPAPRQGCKPRCTGPGDGYKAFQKWTASNQQASRQDMARRGCESQPNKQVRRGQTRAEERVTAPPADILRHPGGYGCCRVPGPHHASGPPPHLHLREAPNLALLKSASRNGISFSHNHSQRTVRFA